MDREIRILHTADTHLGYKQYHNEVRRNDFFAAFEIVINDAIDMQVDAIVHAGDLFDSRNPTLEDLLETINILSRLKVANIPLFGIVGNHESKQNTQWLDLIEEMGLAARLGKKPRLVGDVAIYGIDSVPKSKIPLFDYSGFEAPDTSQLENCRKLLVMHQIVQPFPYAEWDCAEMLEKLPFRVDAILLGDYHKYEKIKVGETWVTYPGSTERNSASEGEPRSYNIITLSNKGLEISRRTIPTRHFLPIPVTLKGEEKSYEQIFSAINEHLEELPGSVVLLEISGDSGSVLSFSEIEEYLLNKGALVPRVRDLRIKESFPDEVLKVTFSDPDHAVANEIKRMSLNDGGLIVDEIIRNPNVPRSRVDEETEGRLSKLIEVIDFKDPDFRIEIPISSARVMESQEAIHDIEIMLNEDIKPATETEFAGKNEFIGAITGNSDILRASDKIESPAIKNPEFSAVSVKSSGSSSEPSSLSEPDSESVFECASEPASESVFECASEPVSESVSECASESVSECASESVSEIVSEPAYEPAFPQEIHEILTKCPEKEIDIRKDGENEPEKEVVNLPEPEAEASPGKEAGSKADELSGEKPIKVSDTTGKAAKKGQKKGKGKPAVPRQYNLGDYL